MTILGLPDGRALEIEVSGPEGGTPLLFHHGTPGSATQLAAMAGAAHARGLRFVTYSRAGYGGSDRRAGRAVVDVVGDVEAVLDHLGVTRCVVAGWSGGGPHALATGARLADRVHGVLVIAGVAPYRVDELDFLAGMGEDNVVEFGLAIDGEAALRPMLEEAAPSLRQATAETVATALAGLLPPPDVAVLTDDLGAALAENLAHGVRHGIDGWLDDDLAFVKPWGFDLAEITVPTFLWQGSVDLMVPFAHGQWLAGHVPGATAHLIEGEGHLSIAVGALDAMLDELAGTAA